MNDVRLICLRSPGCSVVLECLPDEAPLWRYWGPRLAEAAVPGFALRDTRPLPSFTLDFDQPLSIAPTFGVGWFHQASLLAHRDGRQFAQAWSECEITQSESACTVCLRDPVAELEVKVSLQLSHADVLLLSTSVRNLGSTALQVQQLNAASLPLPSHAQTVRYYVGQHMHEFMQQEEPLCRSIWRRENRRGRTSQDNFPGAVVTTPGATEHTGLVYGAHLAWSGNAQQSIEWLNDGLYQWSMGEWLAPGEVILEAGQSLHSPEMIASCSTLGFNGLAQNFHAELRSRLTWPQGKMSVRKVHLNTWEGFYFDVAPEKVKELATAAADLGVERFVLDDGWFHARHHDRAGLGDWWPDATKFPQGLGDLIAHVNGLGMEFGLWFEPEMINPDSDTFRAHPDWALQLAGRPLITARNQLVLDISRKEVRNYLFEKIDALLAAHPIRYIKWDHNRDLTVAGLADGTAGYRKQVLAVYSLMQDLRAEHPLVEIESCSGGGGRIDFAVLRHTQRVWLSDCIDALSRVDIQRGFLQFFPPEIMGAHIGTAPAHTTGRTQSMGFRAAVALSGHFGIELDARSLDHRAKSEVRAWVALYQQLRHRLHQGQVWQGQAEDHQVWQAHGDAACTQVLLLVYRLQASSFKYTPAVRLPMLLGKGAYVVKRITPALDKQDHWFMPETPFFAQLTQGVTLDGDWLAQVGMPMPRGLAETCYILSFEKIKQNG